MHRIEPRSGELFLGRPYCWTLPSRMPSGEESKIFVLRRIPGAPSKQETLVLHNASDLVGIVLDHERLTAGIRRQAREDALTGLPNRRVFLDELNAALETARRANSNVAIFCLDLDDFKFCNDSGHQVGDQLLQLVAHRLRAWMPPNAMIARIGGDEFAILLRDGVNEAEVEAVLRLVGRALESPFRFDGIEFFTTASAGVSVFPRDGGDSDQLLRAADAALYHAKSLGSGGSQFYTKELAVSVRRQFAIRNQLQHALEREEFSLVYQPQFSLASGRMVGVEALLRWTNAALGVVPPSEFIPALESCGLIVEIGKWVLRKACLQARSWRQIFGGDCPRIAVNVSAVQLRQPDFVDFVRDAIDSFELPLDALELELTESVVMTDNAQSRSALERLRGLASGLRSMILARDTPRLAIWRCCPSIY